MSTQTHWTIESPKHLKGMEKHFWKGEWPFFVPLRFDTGDPLWVEVPVEFVRGLLIHFWLDIRLECGGSGTGLYATPISCWDPAGIDGRHVELFSMSPGELVG